MGQIYAATKGCWVIHMKTELTEKEYWDSTYSESSDIPLLNLSGYKQYCLNKIYKKKQPHLSPANKILEIGGGGSAWLIYLAREFPEKNFVSLDYSEMGCRVLKTATEKYNIMNIDIRKDDFFNTANTPQDFDFVYSHGVVEHFSNLSEVLRCHSLFLSSKGVMLTIIPNMAGILGLLTKLLNHKVYEIHVPHDLKSFADGHIDAGLNIIESGYLCSNNFGVLSSCVRKQFGCKWQAYKLLSRLSKMVWFFEEKAFSLPATKLFSPYIYAVSKKAD